MPVLPSPFVSFLRWSDWLYAQVRRTDTIALARLAELLFQFLTTELQLDSKSAAETLWRDWQRGGRNDPPEFLRPWLPENSTVRQRSRSTGLKRQSRHLANADAPPAGH